MNADEERRMYPPARSEYEDEPECRACDGTGECPVCDPLEDWCPSCYGTGSCADCCDVDDWAPTTEDVAVKEGLL